MAGKLGSYLRRHGRAIQVVVIVPRRLRHKIGKAKLIKSLGRLSIQDAERRKWPVVRAMRAELAHHDRLLRGGDLEASPRWARLGECENSGEMIAAFKARRQAMGMTQGDLDFLAEMQDGYTAKLECGDRFVSLKVLSGLLDALALRLVIEGEPVEPMRKKIRRQYQRVTNLRPVSKPDQGQTDGGAV